jgi:hypothetical protein
MKFTKLDIILCVFFYGLAFTLDFIIDYHSVTHTLHIGLNLIISLISPIIYLLLTKFRSGK